MITYSLVLGHNNLIHISISAGDEGAKFLVSLNKKQSAGEPEIPGLCQMWGGEGEETSLKEKDRKVGRTSFSFCLYIQPKPLFDNLVGVGQGTGFMDRNLMLCTMPQKERSSVRIENVKKLKEKFPDNPIGTFFKKVFLFHYKQKRKYTLTPSGELYFNTILDEIVDEFNSLYKSEGI